MQNDRRLAHEFLATLQVFRTLRRHDLGDQSLVYSSYTPGKLYVVERGYVRLVFIQSDGHQLTRMLLGQGALFGDLPYSPATFKSEELAIVNGESGVLEIERAEMEEISRRDGEFRQLLLESLATQMQFLDRRLQWQMRSPLDARVAMILADLVCFSGATCHHYKGGHFVDVRMTHEEFSELVSAARPTVSAILKGLSDQGIIGYTRSHLCLLDIDVLRRIAES